MGFTEAVQTVFTRHYAKFTGRAGRSEFWWFALFYFLTVVALGVLLVLLGGQGLMQGAPPSIGAMFIMLVMGLFILASLVPMIALTVRRLHDRNLSGWWYLAAIVASFIPVLGRLASIAMLVVCALPGTPGPNRFGDAPPRGTALPA